MSGLNSNTRTHVWQAILGAAAPLVIPGTGAVVTTGGAPSAVNGTSGDVLTAQTVGAPIFAPVLRRPLGPVRFIDPANSTGFASDSNTGATATNIPPGSGPILTTVHLVDLLFNRKLLAAATITYMSDDTSGVPLDYSTVDTSEFALTFQGTPQVLHTGGTFNAGTIAINPAAAGGGQRQTVHTTDIADFAPFVFSGFGGTATDLTYVKDTSGGNADTRAWIASGAGSATASVSRPTTPGITAGTLTIGDSYTIQRGSILRISQPTRISASIELIDFAFDASSSQSGELFIRCSFMASLNGDAFMQDCAVGGGIFAVGGLITQSAGLLNVTTSDACTYLALDSDTYIRGAAFLVGPANYDAVVVVPGFGAGVQFQDMSGSAIVVLGSDHLRSNMGVAGALLWGKGNANGIQIEEGGVIIVAAATPPTVTGANDFVFVDLNAGNRTVARAFNEAVGAYTEAGGVATRTTTWAHFTATIGAGGFNFQAHDVSTGAAIIGS